MTETFLKIGNLRPGFGHFISNFLSFVGWFGRFISFFLFLTLFCYFHVFIKSQSTNQGRDTTADFSSFSTMKAPFSFYCFFLLIYSSTSTVEGNSNEVRFFPICILEARRGFCYLDYNDKTSKWGIFLTWMKLDKNCCCSLSHGCRKKWNNAHVCFHCKCCFPCWMTSIQQSECVNIFESIQYD